MNFIASPLFSDGRVADRDLGEQIGLEQTVVDRVATLGNAYAIHGQGSERRYLAAHAVRGAAPDFHRLECFAALPGA